VESSEPSADGRDGHHDGDGHHDHDALPALRPGARVVFADHQPDHLAVIEVSGELDAFSSPQLSAATANVEDAHGIVIDLARCSAIDGAALWTLADIAQQLGGRTPVLVVLPLEPVLRDMVEQDHDVRAMTTFGSRSAAIRAALDA
jgi:anti-anti-sigma regulatory factor